MNDKKLDKEIKSCSQELKNINKEIEQLLQSYGIKQKNNKIELINKNNNKIENKKINLNKKI